MTSFDERANGIRWRLRAMRRLWAPQAQPGMTFLAPEPPEEEAMGAIDHPPPDAKLSGELFVVSGWAAFKVGPTTRVEVWLDDRFVGRARLAQPRIDIEEGKEMSHGGTSGFELTLDLETVRREHAAERAELRVVAYGTGGQRYDLDPVAVSLSSATPAPRSDSLSPPVPFAPASKGDEVRVMVFTHQLNLGGGQLYLMDLLRGLRERGGFALTVLSAMDGVLREELEEMGIPVHITGVLPVDDLSSHLGRLEELTVWAEPYGFELAFVNTATALSFPGAEVAARLGIPTVWAIHESFEPAILWAGFDPRVRDGAEAALAAARFAVFEAKATQRIFEPLLDSRRCLTLPYGLDMHPIDAKRSRFDAAQARRKARVPADANLIVCVGTVEPRKAQVPLAQAFELIAARHPDARLVFVGGRKRDPNSVLLEECIESSPHGDQMRLIPITPDVDPWYGMADLLVCASDVESLPRTVLEAMAWETPVLATSVFGLPELIDEGETGWLCEPRDLQQLAEGLDRALSAPAEQRTEIARASRRLVEDRHSLNNYANEVAGVFRRALEDDAGGER